MGLLDVLLGAPEAGALLEGGVRVALDARELTERCMGIFRRDDETDRLLREETAALIPAELTTDDGDVQLVVQELPVEIRRLVGADINIHRRVLLHVVL